MKNLKMRLMLLAFVCATITAFTSKPVTDDPADWQFYETGGSVGNKTAAYVKETYCQGNDEVNCAAEIGGSRIVQHPIY